MRTALTVSSIALSVVACGGDGQDGSTADADPGDAAPGALQITAVDLPELDTGAAAPVVATVIGRPNAPVEFILTASSGTFTPATGSVILDANGAGLIESEYTAPDDAGTYAHLLSAADDQGASAGRAFSAVVRPAEVHLGYDEPLPGTMQLAGNAIYAQPIHVPAATTLLRFGVIGMAGPRARLALYTDQFERPYYLISATAIFSMSNGRRELESAPRALAAGNYWIAIELENAASIRTDTGGAPLTIFSGVSDLGPAAPHAFPQNNVLSHPAMNLYVVVDND